MDYVVGGVAALVNGNVTPNRPKLQAKIVAPVKHQQSPNVTPKGGFVTDRSIFLSPTMVKRKDILKKSPKRIFDNPDNDSSSLNESKLSSPKISKAKKRLHEESNIEEKKGNIPELSENTGKQKNKNKKNKGNNSEAINKTTDNKQNPSNIRKDDTVTSTNPLNKAMNNEKRKKRNKNKEQKDSSEKNVAEITKDELSVSNESNKPQEKNADKKDIGKKQKNKNKQGNKVVMEACADFNGDKSKELTNKKKGNKNKKKRQNKQFIAEQSFDDEESDDSAAGAVKKNFIVNPNAITDKDSDSEHESDDNIDSEDENKEDKDEAESSSDEEDKNNILDKKKNITKLNDKPESDESKEEVIKKTLFIGNVPFTKKTKKRIKQIFEKYGEIDTVRIRALPIKDSNTTPKMAAIKHEIHPDRTTVNVYIKFMDASSVEKALVENNTVMDNCHLRVSRSDDSGQMHDPKMSIFVGNLPFAIEDEVLRAKFEKCGDIHSVRIVRDKKTNIGKGFGYVNFESKDAVELALSLSAEDLTIKNRIIRVERCTQSQNNKNKEQKKKNIAQNNRNNFLNNRNNSQNNRNFSKDRNNFSKDRGNFSNNQNNRNNFQNKRNNFQNDRNENNFGNNPNDKEQGAYRRLQNKRKNQDDKANGPPEKKNRSEANDQLREKKQKKEFVGMTADKKKKKNFNKDSNKKKKISEILTK